MIPKTTIEKSLLFLITLVVSGALIQLFAATSGDEPKGDPRAEALLGVLYGVLLLIAFVDRERTVLALHRIPALSWLLLLSFVSAGWSESPALVLQRSIAIAGTSLLGVVLATHLNQSQQLRLLQGVLRSCAALSLLCIIVAPQYGIATGDTAGNWRGIFQHKNGLGSAMAMALLVERYAAGSSRRGNLARFVWVCVEFALLWQSKSATALVSVVAALALVTLFKALRWKLRIGYGALALVLILCVTAALTFAGIGSMTSLLGKSSSLTGRVPLWELVLKMIYRHPLLGYGYSGFWGGASSESDLVTSSTFDAYYSHNGYLEIALSLGLVGLLLVVSFLLQGARNALAYAESIRGSNALWPAAFLLYFLFHNLAECSIMWQNSLEWAVCITVILTVSPGTQIPQIVSRASRWNLRMDNTTLGRPVAGSHGL